MRYLFLAKALRMRFNNILQHCVLLCFRHRKQKPVRHGEERFFMLNSCLEDDFDTAVDQSWFEHFAAQDALLVAPLLKSVKG